mmetsp:Transcript_68160/g.148686  ORF Transcript_68160/g.148686 Transcript_68160/m.148686 type:complete len:1081 (+) Transcript_68160:79-3321(+)
MAATAIAKEGGEDVKDAFWDNLAFGPQEVPEHDLWELQKHQKYSDVTKVPAPASVIKEWEADPDNRMKPYTKYGISVEIEEESQVLHKAAFSLQLTNTLVGVPVEVRGLGKTTVATVVKTDMPQRGKVYVRFAKNGEENFVDTHDIQMMKTINLTGPAQNRLKAEKKLLAELELVCTNITLAHAETRCPSYHLGISAPVEATIGKKCLVSYFFKDSLNQDDHEKDTRVRTATGCVVIQPKVQSKATKKKSWANDWKSNSWQDDKKGKGKGKGKGKDKGGKDGKGKDGKGKGKKGKKGDKGKGKGKGGKGNDDSNEAPQEEEAPKEEEEEDEETRAQAEDSLHRCVLYGTLSQRWLGAKLIKFLNDVCEREWERDFYPSPPEELEGEFLPTWVPESVLPIILGDKSEALKKMESDLGLIIVPCRRVDKADQLRELYSHKDLDVTGFEFGCGDITFGSPLRELAIFGEPQKRFLAQSKFWCISQKNCPAYLTPPLGSGAMQLDPSLGPANDRLWVTSMAAQAHLVERYVVLVRKAAACSIECCGTLVIISGTHAERVRAREYLNFMIQWARVGTDTGDLELPHVERQTERRDTLFLSALPKNIWTSTQLKQQMMRLSEQHSVLLFFDDWVPTATGANKEARRLVVASTAIESEGPAGGVAERVRSLVQQTIAGLDAPAVAAAPARNVAPPATPTIRPPATPALGRPVPGPATPAPGGIRPPATPAAAGSIRPPATPLPLWQPGAIRPPATPAGPIRPPATPVVGSIRPPATPTVGGPIRPPATPVVTSVRPPATPTVGGPIKPPATPGGPLKPPATPVIGGPLRPPSTPAPVKAPATPAGPLRPPATPVGPLKPPATPGGVGGSILPPATPGFGGSVRPPATPANTSGAPGLADGKLPATPGGISTPAYKNGSSSPGRPSQTFEGPDGHQQELFGKLTELEDDWMPPVPKAIIAGQEESEGPDGHQNDLFGKIQQLEDDWMPPVPGAIVGGKPVESSSAEKRPAEKRPAEPTEPEEAPAPKKKVLSFATFAQEEPEVKPDPKPEEDASPLPPGWEIRTSKSSGKSFYWNKKLNKTQYKRPTE